MEQNILLDELDVMQFSKIFQNYNISLILFRKKQQPVNEQLLMQI